MPSSNKTSHLRLNRWVGTDKPKKDDFNDDNLLIDAACKALEQSVAQARSDLGAQFAQLGETVSQNQQTLSASLSGHTQNGAVHLTAAERTKWDGAAFGIATYTGNGQASRKITLGYKPRFGVVFAAVQPVVDYSAGGEYLYLYMAFMSSSGNSGGVSLQDDGFTVLNNATTNPAGFAYRLNTSGETYVYLTWK